ncbi:hypothetical protein BDV93DRAFT_550717 [Ceratobasidium sp. AG-I]|nr:hypothetical protein BDV93DRAFT_550717 [Ceratobasidium sp. AG-I]
MSGFTPFTPQVDYRPVQINPAQPPYHRSLTVPPQQQPQPGQHLLPQPGNEPPLQTQALVHTPGPGYPPASPFEWVLSSLTTLLHAQHHETTAKLEETANHQRALSAKVDTLQRAADEMRQTISALSTTVQGISNNVTRLGTDMSSRDATLASRLSALDDAIDAWSVETKMPSSAGAQAESLQTPPASDIQRSEVVNPPAEMQAAEPEENTLSSFMDATMEPESRRSSSPLSSPRPSPRLAVPAPDGAPVEMALVPYKKSTKVPQTPAKPKKAKTITAPDTVRRSSRTPKKRKQHDALAVALASTSNKKLKTTAKAIVKKRSSSKLSEARFNWDSIDVYTDDQAQVVQCDSCDIWYHLGCVSLLPNDSILDEDVWMCPPCEFESLSDPAYKHRSRVSQRHKCRPDCTVEGGSEETFTIESIIGRYPHLADSTGRIMQYLVKWEDWGTQYATWTPQGEIGTKSHELITAFENAARNEGLDLSERQALILLQQASDAGWGFNTSPPQA